MNENEMLASYVNAVYQNIKTALQSLKDIMPKVEDEEFKKELAKEEDVYFTLCK